MSHFFLFSFSFFLRRLNSFCVVAFFMKQPLQPGHGPDQFCGGNVLIKTKII